MPECGDWSGGKEGGDKNRSTNIKFSLGYQTKGGLHALVRPPRPNVANFGVARPSPGGTRMTTDIPREALPMPSTLAGQSIPQSLSTPT